MDQVLPQPSSKRNFLAIHQGGRGKRSFQSQGALDSLSRAMSSDTFWNTRGFSLRCRQRPVPAHQWSHSRDWLRDRAWPEKPRAENKCRGKWRNTARGQNGNQIKILSIEIYTLNSQDDFSRIKTMKYWSQNMKDEKRASSHPLKLMKVWFDLKTISIAKLMVRKEIKLCIMAAFQESGAEDRDMQENRKTHYKDFFFFCSFLVHSELHLLLFHEWFFKVLHMH